MVIIVVFYMDGALNTNHSARTLAEKGHKPFGAKKMLPLFKRGRHESSTPVQFWFTFMTYHYPQRH